MGDLKSLRILIADDHEIIRRGLRALLSSAISKAAEHRPDIVVMDIAMPVLNGLEATRKIRRMLPMTEVVILSLHYSDQLVREVLDSGARAYILKSDASRDLFHAVEALAQHRSFFTSGAVQILVDGFCSPSSATQQPALMRKSLSAREREIVQLLAEGKSSKEVAVILGISVKTAETHRANIMRKLEMHSVSELVRYAVKHCMIEP